jgi:hexokinase
MKDVNIFLKEHKIRSVDIDLQKLVDVITLDMEKGLEGADSSLRMIPTYIEADNQFLTEVPVVAIDAGGTNFRAAIVKFNRHGKLELSDLMNARMPGIDGEISKEEFFRTIAGYVRPLAEKCDRIGFCFSYPSEILPDKDGRLLQFCKEVEAPGVVGQLIGKNLLQTLKMPHKQIVLLNDTVATLLAGKSASFGKSYDSFIGYILGTGTNTCYIESNRNIIKKPDLDPGKSQIINIESGNFGKATRTDIDIQFDNTTINPGEYTFEKMISGGYLGGLCLTALKRAASEDVFSVGTASNLMLLNELSTEEVSTYLNSTLSGRGPLAECIAGGADEENSVRIAVTIIDRAAKMVCANLAAVLLKTNKGKSPDRPILITVEGTAFYKLNSLKSLFEKYFKEYLSGELERYYKFTEVPQSSLAGAALAALIN